MLTNGDPGAAPKTLNLLRREQPITRGHRGLRRHRTFGLSGSRRGTCWARTRHSCPVLASLLPGVRHLRAPLASGYLWLLALYIAFAPLVPQAVARTGIWQTLHELAELVGVVGATVALSAAAYLVGALSGAVFAGPTLWQSTRLWVGRTL